MGAGALTPTSPALCPRHTVLGPRCPRCSHVGRRESAAGGGEIIPSNWKLSDWALQNPQEWPASPAPHLSAVGLCARHRSPSRFTCPHHPPRPDPAPGSGAPEALPPWSPVSPAPTAPSFYCDASAQMSPLTGAFPEPPQGEVPPEADRLTLGSSHHLETILHLPLRYPPLKDRQTDSGAPSSSQDLPCNQDSKEMSERMSERMNGE